MRALIKLVALWCYVHVLARARNAWRRRTGTCHVSVLLYHRVSDERLDSITVTPKQFRRHLRLLSRRYDVISMDRFLHARGMPRRRPAVVVTFDDGYRDNYDAAKCLYEANIPCTFFVSTGIVGTSESFPLDVRLQRRMPVLSWDQIAEMSAWGFDIANHSVGHIDMGRTSVTESLCEIQQASRDLTARLCGVARDQWFAYPFGGRHHIKSETRKRLKEIGIECCLSACGGVNGPDFDPYDIVRQGVNHSFSDLAFLAVVEGYRVRCE